MIPFVVATPSNIGVLQLLHSTWETVRAWTPVLISYPRRHTRSRILLRVVSEPKNVASLQRKSLGIIQPECSRVATSTTAPYIQPSSCTSAASFAMAVGISFTARSLRRGTSCSYWRRYNERRVEKHAPTGSWMIREMEALGVASGHYQLLKHSYCTVIQWLLRPLKAPVGFVLTVIEGIKPSESSYMPITCFECTE